MRLEGRSRQLQVRTLARLEAWLARPWSDSHRLGMRLGVTAAVAILVLPWWLDFVQGHGRNLPPHDVKLDYALGLIWAAGLGATLRWWPVSLPERRALALVWAAKVAVALGAMLIFESHYPVSDAVNSYYLASQPETFTWGPGDLKSGTTNVAALAWVAQWAAPDSYHALKIMFSFLGLVAVYAFYRAACLVFRQTRPVLLLGLGLFPSVLFWSGILGKDPVVLLFIGLHVLAMASWQVYRRPTWIVGAAAAAVGATLVRPWIGFLLLLPSAVLVAASGGGPRRPARSLMKIALVLAVVVGSMLALASRFEIASATDIVDFFNHISGATGEGGSNLPVPTLSGPVEMLVYLPWGAFTALLRPFPGEVLEPLAFGLLASLDAVLLLALAGRAVRRARASDLREPLVWLCIGIIACWTVFYAFISATNLGTASRYRLQVAPLLLLLLFFLGRPRRDHAENGIGRLEPPPTAQLAKEKGPPDPTLGSGLGPGS